MLAEGVALAPGAYEALFVGLGHDDAVLDEIGVRMQRRRRACRRPSSPTDSVPAGVLAYARRRCGSSSRGESGSTIASLIGLVLLLDRGPARRRNERGRAVGSAGAR